MTQTTHDDSHQAWIVSRLSLGVNAERLPLADLSGQWQEAAAAWCKGGKQAFDLYCQSLPDGGQELLNMVYRFDSRAPDPAMLALRDKTHWTFDELLTTAFPDPVWTIPEYLPVGLCSLAGRPKVGKSWLALQIAHAVGTGGRVLDQAVEKGKVLYLALEDSAQRLKQRLQKQGAALGIDSEAYTVWPMFGDGGLTRLQDEIGREGHTLIVIDTLSRFLGRADQLDHAAMTVAIGELQRLAQMRDLTILTIDHHRKANAFASDPIDDILGSTAKSAILDAAWGLYKERGKQGATLRITGRDLIEMELSLQWDGLTCTWQLLGETDQVRKNTFRADVLDAIRALNTLGELATTAKIAEYLDKSNSYVSHTLADLLNNGDVIKAPKEGKEQPYALSQQ